METSSGGGRDARFSMGYNISLLSGNETGPELYGNSVHSRPSTSITSGLSRSGLGLAGCGGSLSRGLKRSSSDVCYDQDGRQTMSMSGDCGSDIVEESYSPTPQKGSPPANGKKTKGRVKIKMEYIDNKLRRYTTFSKRKTGIMKKAYELSTLTGTQVMLLVASETGHVYTFATRKLQPMITSDAGKALIQTCLNSPDPCGSGPSSSGDQRMSATGFEETELSYNIADEEQKESLRSPGCSEPASPADSSSSASPPPMESSDTGISCGREGRRSPPPLHLPPAPNSPLLNPRTTEVCEGIVMGCTAAKGNTVVPAVDPEPGEPMITADKYTTSTGLSDTDNSGIQAMASTAQGCAFEVILNEDTEDVIKKHPPKRIQRLEDQQLPPLTKELIKEKQLGAEQRRIELLNKRIQSAKVRHQNKHRRHIQSLDSTDLIESLGKELSTVEL